MRPAGGFDTRENAWSCHSLLGWPQNLPEDKLRDMVWIQLIFPFPKKSVRVP
jgi:hypothetical protein